MGVIISSFIGCGKQYMTNIYSGKIKIAECEKSNKPNDEFVDEVLRLTTENDIVFVSSSSDVRNALEERGVDFDVFFPSKTRHLEFIEAQVRKRTSPQEIRKLDKDFEDMIDEIEGDESPHCYKHMLSKFGQFIGNNDAIMGYLGSIKTKENGQ